MFSDGSPQSRANYPALGLDPIPTVSFDEIQFPPLTETHHSPSIISIFSFKTPFPSCLASLLSLFPLSTCRCYFSPKRSCHFHYYLILLVVALDLDINSCCSSHPSSRKISHNSGRKQAACLLLLICLLPRCNVPYSAQLHLFSFLFVKPPTNKPKPGLAALLHPNPKLHQLQIFYPLSFVSNLIHTKPASRRLPEAI